MAEQKEVIDTIKQFISAMFVSGSAEANEINHLFIIFSILSAIMLSIVGFMVVGGILLFRSGKQEGEPRQITGNKYLEIVWTVIPLGMVIVLFILSLNVMKRINSPVSEGKEPDIKVTAHQWWWDFHYTGKDVITSNELHIPAGQKLLLQINSADVIHSWWVPALGRKTDALPGQNNYSWIKADSIGIYEGTCSEYCGAQHAWMRIRVVAEDPDHYNQWLTNQQRLPSEPADSLSRIGERLFQEKTCGNCHSIAGTKAGKHIGPDLTHLASRKTLLAGLKSNSRQNLKQWLANPQHIKKGAHMPDFLLSDHELNALVKYLNQLK